MYTFCTFTFCSSLKRGLVLPQVEVFYCLSTQGGHLSPNEYGSHSAPDHVSLDTRQVYHKLLGT